MIWYFCFSFCLLLSKRWNKIKSWHSPHLPVTFQQPVETGRRIWLLLIIQRWITIKYMAKKKKNQEEIAKCLRFSENISSECSSSNCYCLCKSNKPNSNLSSACLLRRAECLTPAFPWITPSLNTREQPFSSVLRIAQCFSLCFPEENWPLF